PAVGDRWQGCTQSAQLAVLARQGLVPHRAQLEVALRRAQARILGLQPLAALEALPDPAPGCGRGVHRELDGVSGGLQQVAQQRAAAREHDATLGDVRAQFRRSLLERLLHRAYDVLQRLLQRLQNLVAIEREAARHAFGEVAALDRELAHLLPGIGRADLDLD